MKQEQTLVLYKFLLLYNQICLALNSQELDKDFLLSPLWQSHISANKSSFCFPVGSSKAFSQNFERKLSTKHIFYQGDLSFHKSSWNFIVVVVLGGSFFLIIYLFVLFFPEIWKVLVYTSKLFIHFCGFPMKTNKPSQKQLQLAWQSSPHIVE